MNEYGFTERMRMSNGFAATANINEILLDSIPGATCVMRASAIADKTGVDYWVKRECERDLGVDIKTREQDFRKIHGADDLALELWSDVSAGRIGWTLDINKRTDYILWFWKDTKRWVLIPFPMLCAVFIANREKWTKQYKHPFQASRENGRVWRSQCVFVPRHEIWAAIYRTFGGMRTNNHTAPPSNGLQLDLELGWSRL